ncbi:Flp pilus assembly protein CpaB [Spongiibacter tropicus]|uniref:Flp pilus assembly protein CpaB n=1 Tax=Spongiibacter tropicus TaxID=454602 RepID=UPI0003B427CE|nr:Flp pilus assembly protein CpaB [Spongiibacter tropicus]
MSISKYRYPIALVAAFLCAIAAFFLTKNYFEVRERDLREKIRSEARLVDIVVAKTDLPAGTRIDLETMTIKSVPSEYVPDGVIYPVSYPDVEMKYLSVPMSAGKPLIRYMVEGVSRIEKFSDLLSFGERAITLEVDSVSSIAHMLEAGDYIDLGVVKDKGEKFQLILERVRVLSTGNFSIAEKKIPGMYKNSQYSSVTLGVSGEYVKKVYEAQLKHQLVFLLRNERDKKPLSYAASSERDGIVTVYAGVNSEGVIDSYKDAFAIEKESSMLKVIRRNSKGRLIRLMSDNGFSKDD